MAIGNWYQYICYFFSVICYLSSISYLNYRIISIFHRLLTEKYLQGYHSRFQSAEEFMMSVMFANDTGENKSL